jgi:hypothetical protein
MASDSEKRQADWKSASQKYCARLEDMIDELRHNIEIVPAAGILASLAEKSEVIQRAGQCFRDDVKRAVKSEPKPPSPPNEYADH